MRFRFLVLFLVLSGVVAGSSSHGLASLVFEDVEGLCIPPVLAMAPTSAQCTFDIWGYVFNADGQPVSGVIVSDGANHVVTDAAGFYDLYEFLPGGRNLNAYHPGSCDRSETVHVTFHGALLEGGFHQDFQLPCNP